MPYGFIGAVGECKVGSNVTTSNAAVILTDSNIICFTSDILASYTSAGETLLTLPEEVFFPKSTIFVPVVVTSETGVRVTYMKINAAGQISMDVALVNSTIHLGSVTVSINDKYYSKAIGNIGGFTRPIGRR